MRGLALTCMRREHSVKPRQVHPRRRHERCQPGDEVQRLQHDGRPHLGLGLHIVALVAAFHRRARDVAAQPLGHCSCVALPRASMPASNLPCSEAPALIPACSYQLPMR